MEIIDQLKLARASVTLQAEIQTHGQVPAMGLDFRRFKSIVDELEDRDISDQFNWNFETLKPTEAFWIVCRDSNDATIGVVAAKLENLGPMQAPEYWQLQHPRVYRDNAGGPINFEPVQSRASQALKGKLVYLGDGWVREDVRKTGFAPALVKLAMLTSLAWWDFDTVYAFVHDAGMIKGLGTDFGFCHNHPVAIRWIDNPPQLLRDNWLVYNHRPDVLDLIDELSGAHASADRA